MSAALPWLLLGAALLLCPAPGVRRPRRSTPISRQSLQIAAAAGVAVAALVLFGATVGVLVGAPGGVGAAIVVGRLHGRAPPQVPSAALAAAVDLAAAALRAGRPLADALALAAPAADPAARAGLERVAGLLRLGADPDEAWAVTDGDAGLAPVAAAARRSAVSGVRLADGFERLAADVRAGLRTGAEARAHRVGVLAAAPLGLCFLPAFVCLGIVPTVIGVAGGVLGTIG